MSVSAGTIDDLAARLRALRDGSGERVIVGIAGAPGSGKSTIAKILDAQLGPRTCAIVPMDGFHLAGAVIDGTPLLDRKGAIDTFDADGYVSLLRRLRDRGDDVVYAPAYVRGLEEPIAASIAVPRDVPIVITEGNYLLVGETPWDQIPGLLDEVWFVECSDDVRRRRLIQRHMSYGMSSTAAAAWADGTDALNAQLVASTRAAAAHVITWD